MTSDQHDDIATYQLDETISSKLKLNDAGLIPAIVQAQGTGEVLMLAWMDTHALAYTLATGRGTYYSRSRQQYWVKGLTSGNTQKVTDVRLDCDGDTILLEVQQRGGACHLGTRTCFDSGRISSPQLSEMRRDTEAMS